MKKEKPKTIVLNNFHLPPLIKVLSYDDTTFVQARARDRFLRPIIERARDVEEYRLELCKKLCLKDKDLKPIMEKDTTGRENFKFDKNGRKSFEEEFEKLVHEDLLIELNFIVEKDLKYVNMLIEMSEVPLSQPEVNAITNFLYIVDEALKDKGK